MQFERELEKVLWLSQLQIWRNTLFKCLLIVCPPILWRPPYIAYPLPLFQICPTTPLSCRLQSPPPLLILLSCFFGWMGDRDWCDRVIDVLFYLMISWMYTCRAIGPWLVKTRDNVLLDPRQRLFNHLNNLSKNSGTWFRV